LLFSLDSVQVVKGAFVSDANAGELALLAVSSFSVFFILVTACRWPEWWRKPAKVSLSRRYFAHEGHHQGNERKAQRNCKVSVGEGLDLRLAVCKQPEPLERSGLASRGIAPGLSIAGRYPVEPIVQLSI
jgi:hypothetical protein